MIFQIGSIQTRNEKAKEAQKKSEETQNSPESNPE